MKRVMQAPKAAAGKPTLPLIEPAANAIAEYRRWTEEKGITLKEPVDGFDDFVFLTLKGWPLTSAGVNSSLKRAVKGFNKIRWFKEATCACRQYPAAGCVGR